MVSKYVNKNVYMYHNNYIFQVVDAYMLILSIEFPKLFVLPSQVLQFWSEGKSCTWKNVQEASDTTILIDTVTVYISKKLKCKLYQMVALVLIVHI